MYKFRKKEVEFNAYLEYLMCNVQWAWIPIIAGMLVTLRN